MSDTIDTGFDSVLAGEVWSPPDQVVIIRDAPPATPHTCANAAGGTRCDICFEPMSEKPPQISDEPVVTAAVTALEPEPPGLTPDGIQAMKSMLKMPELGPAQLAKLARDVAMDIKERHVVLQEHKLSDAQYDFLEKYNEFYRNALHAACIDWHAPLSTPERIKVEAAAILEDSLIGLGARMQNRSEGLPGVIEAAKLFAKVAGVGEREAGTGAPGERFTINIDLGGDQRTSVSVTPVAPAVAVQGGGGALPDHTKG